MKAQKRHRQGTDGRPTSAVPGRDRARVLGIASLTVYLSVLGCGDTKHAAPSSAADSEPPTATKASEEKADAQGAVLEFGDPTLSEEEAVPSEGDGVASKKSGARKNRSPDTKPPAEPAPSPQASRPSRTASPSPADGVKAATASDSFIDADALRDAMRANIKPLRTCYEQELQVAPDLSGRIKLAFTIGPGGRVITVELEGGMGNIHACLESVLRSIQFPEPTGGGVVKVSYPLTFRTSSNH